MASMANITWAQFVSQGGWWLVCVVGVVSGLMILSNCLDAIGDNVTEAKPKPTAVRALAENICDIICDSLAARERVRDSLGRTLIAVAARERVEQAIISAHAEQNAAARHVLAICKGTLDPDILEQTATLFQGDYPHTAKYLRDAAERLRPAMSRLEAAMEGVA